MERFSKQRRLWLCGALGIALPLAMPGVRAAAMAPAVAGCADRPGAPLAPWQPGWLDIHHIATGRGNATFILFPDGTSLLIDAGASAAGLDVSVAPRPSAVRRPGQWIARYVQRQLRASGQPGLDYLLVTHLHPDHMGDIDAASPLARNAAYRLSGVTDVASLLKIGTLIDRGFPGYDYPSSLQAPFANNYRAFVRARVDAGERVEAFKVGSARQMAGRRHHPGTWSFDVRNVAANGQVWSGGEDEAQQLFPPLSTLPREEWPTENSCSAALRIGYGRFSYFTAGDLTSYTDDGALPWRDVLGPAARAAGPVSVATADHHGMFDGLNAEVVRSLRPVAWIIPSWHISHPDMLQLERMFSQRLYPGPRDVFATTLMAENLRANGRLTRRLRSHDGHVVVRVSPGGENFYIAVTGNRDESDHIHVLTQPYAL